VESSIGAIGATLAVVSRADAVSPFCGAFSAIDGREVIPPYVFSLPWDEKETKFAGGTTW
jgi:hypothetical protein